jgi:hypothetical protein
MPEGLGDLLHGGTGQVKDGPGMRQQQGHGGHAAAIFIFLLCIRPGLGNVTPWYSVGGHVRFAALMLLLPAMNGQVSAAQLAEECPSLPDKERCQNYG